jgi:hypothetical protein
MLRAAVQPIAIFQRRFTMKTKKSETKASKLPKWLQKATLEELTEKAWQEAEDTYLAGFAGEVACCRRLYRTDRSLITSKQMRPDLAAVLHLSECSDAIANEGCMKPNWRKWFRTWKWAPRNLVEQQVGFWIEDRAARRHGTATVPTRPEPRTENSESLKGDLAAAQARIREMAEKACRSENAGALNALSLLIAAQIEAVPIQLQFDASGLKEDGLVAGIKNELNGEQQGVVDWWNTFVRSAEPKYQIVCTEPEPSSAHEDDEDED